MKTQRVTYRRLSKGAESSSSSCLVVAERLIYRAIRPLGQPTVSRSRNWRRVPFSIFQLRFDIWHCPEIAQCSLSIESGSPLSMSNIKSQLENGKCFSFTGSRSTDGTLSEEPSCHVTMP